MRTNVARRTSTGLHAVYALPVGTTALLVLGAVAAGLHGRLGPDGVLAGAALVTAVCSSVAQANAVPLVAVIAWLVSIGFSRAPYGQLHTNAHRALTTAVALVVAAGLGWVAAAVRRRLTKSADAASSREVGSESEDDEAMTEPLPDFALRDLAIAVSRRRQLAAVLLSVVVLPSLTLVLTAARSHLNLDDDLLLYLVVVLVSALVGGFGPAVASAIAACLLLNWFFTPPLHHLTIDAPQNLFALLLFVTVAITVSSVVHLAARRAALARQSGAESETLLGLARTMLGGADTARDVVAHLADNEQVVVELQERVAGRWVRLVLAGEPAQPTDTDADPTVRPIRDDLRLKVFGANGKHIGERILEGYGAQAASALDRERLRVQAAQAEMLAAGNRMRTALLTAVSHDLRTPLASVKASVSSLRQTDIAWSDQDRAELLATIEESADRLDALIANLLDMSRIHTGSLQPLLRPTSLDEIAPAALRGLDAAAVTLDVADTLPLVTTDPGLLERALANLLANALRYSPAGRPPSVTAHAVDDAVVLDVVDHGPGVDHDFRERMFEPFQQLGDRRNSEGVGLGLAVARGFVEATGGTLAALETPGGGLTMRVTLPAVTPTREPAISS